LAGATSSVAASVGLGALALAAMVTVAAASLNLFAANTAQMPPVITRTIESAQVVEVQKSMHINKEYEQNSRADGKKWVQVVNRPGRQPNVS
jgi:DNA-binding transcriptional regulator YdaS (Cro superfamily)